MNVLRIGKFIIGVIALLLAGYHFFIHRIDFGGNWSMVLFIFMFLLIGVDDIKTQYSSNTGGYIFLALSLMLFSGLVYNFLQTL
ncbi:hypothetical protein [Halobacillus sp. K22]|uniref:hypothetical protein n=1 Tax=Halobacillus sp. K22 TaxID=3457431 RepID=UPI003FCDD208